MKARRYEVDIMNKKIVKVDKDIKIVEDLSDDNRCSSWYNLYSLGLHTELYKIIETTGYYVYTSKKEVDMKLERVRKITDGCLVTIYITNFSIPDEKIIKLALHPYEAQLNNTFNKISKIETLTRIQKNNRSLCKNIKVFYISSLDLEDSQTDNIYTEKFECREYVDNTIEIYKCLLNGYSKVDILDKFKFLTAGDYMSTFEGLNNVIKYIDDERTIYGYKVVYEHRGKLYTTHYGNVEEEKVKLIAFERFKNYILD